MWNKITNFHCKHLITNFNPPYPPSPICPELVSGGGMSRTTVINIKKGTTIFKLL